MQKMSDLPLYILVASLFLDYGKSATLAFLEYVALDGLDQNMKVELNILFQHMFLVWYKCENMICSGVRGPTPPKCWRI